jgi:hypothetical protein
MKIALILLFGLLAFPVLALDDTIANREEQANRYITERPIKALVTAEIEANADKDGPALHDEKMRVLKFMDWQAIDKKLREEAIKIYTADELKALADMCATPAGCSALNKVAAISAALKPTTDLETSRAIILERLDKLKQK